MLKHSAGDLAQMQSLPLEAKVNMSKRRIQEWYEAFGGNVYVSFSGGKDSTVLLHLVRSVYPDAPAVFCDTGLEFPEIRKFAMNQENVTVVKPEMNFRNVLLTYGYPIPSKEVARKLRYARRGADWAQKFVDGSAVDKEGRTSRYVVSKRWLKLLDAPFDVSDQCCDVMKKKPMNEYSRKTGRKPFIGTLACESLVRAQGWQRTGCNAFEMRHPHSTPMAFWTENDVLEYIVQNDLKIASIYGDIVQEDGQYKTTGAQRTGCMFCMFGCHMDGALNRFQKMKETHPKQYAYCMKPVEEGGLGLDEVLTYAGIPH